MGTRNIALNYMVDNGIMDGTQKEQLTQFVPAGQGNMASFGVLTNTLAGNYSVGIGSTPSTPSPASYGTTNVDGGNTLNKGSTPFTGVNPQPFDRQGMVQLASTDGKSTSDNADGTTAPTNPASPDTKSTGGFIDGVTNVPDADYEAYKKMTPSEQWGRNIGESIQFFDVAKKAGEKTWDIAKKRYNGEDISLDQLKEAQMYQDKLLTQIIIGAAGKRVLKYVKK